MFNRWLVTIYCSAIREDVYMTNHMQALHALLLIFTLLLHGCHNNHRPNRSAVCVCVCVCVCTCVCVCVCVCACACVELCNTDTASAWS